LGQFHWWENGLRTWLYTLAWRVDVSVRSWAVAGWAGIEYPAEDMVPHAAHG